MSLPLPIHMPIPIPISMPIVCRFPTMLLLADVATQAMGTAEQDVGLKFERVMKWDDFPTSGTCWPQKITKSFSHACTHTRIHTHKHTHTGMHYLPVTFPVPLDINKASRSSEMSASLLSSSNIDACCPPNRSLDIPPRDSVPGAYCLSNSHHISFPPTH